MLDKTHKNKILGYIANLLSNRKFVRDYILRICDWLYSDEQTFCKFNYKDENGKLLSDDEFKRFAGSHPLKAFKIIEEFAQKLRQKYGKKALSSNILENNLKQTQKLFNLSNTEREILEIFIYEKCEDFFSEIYRDLTSNHRDMPINERCICLNLTPYQFAKLTSRNSALVRFGLLEHEYNGNLSLNDLGENIYYQTISSQEELQNFLLGSPQKANIEWQCFKHIPQIEFAQKLLSQSLKSHSTGINFLFYGAPGTGKTEFAKTLAAQCKSNLYSLENSEEGFLGKGDNRYKQAIRAETVLNKTKNNVLLIDEGDDILSVRPWGKGKTEKIKVNRMLENNLVPTIWTTNDIASFDKSYLRRFTYAINFTKPTKEAVSNMWLKSLKDNDLPYDDKTVQRLAKKYTISPSFIDSAVKSVRLINGGLPEVEQTLDSLQQAYNGGTKSKDKTERPKQDFNPMLLNTDTDLSLLAERIVNLNRRDFSLCLYGVSGTGKSAFATHLAEVMGMPIVKKKGSDILDMFVGGSEHNIAQAFEEAREKEAMLIFDEADSFLRERSSAHHSWEVTQVNEMLTQMEQHPYPFICTTNLMNNFDKASLRRFTFKVKYDYMTDVQRTLAFEYFFGMDKVNLSHINTLTPGDFVVVKQKAEILGLTDNVKELIAMLEQEQLNKNQIVHKKIGFI